MTKYIIPTVEEIKKSLLQNTPKFYGVSLFAGGGGSSTGYRMAGGEILAINEFIPEAIATYKANWPDTIVLDGDIRKISAQQILEKIGLKEGELDLLDGSPPCSAFSSAGSKEKGWGKTKKYSDSQQKNVEDLFFEYIRILRGIMPKVFVAENVSGLAKGAAKGYLNEILRDLRASNYQVSCKILDAKWLGVPQSRQRAIFVGIRSDIWKPEFENNIHPKPLKIAIPLSKAFEGLSFTEKDKQETDLSRFKVIELLRTLKPGEQHQKAFTLVKASKHGPSPCIKATTGAIGARESYHWDNRAFSVSEIKRIMSIPDDYVLTGSYRQKVERLGRMVAPFMMKHIALNLIKLGVFDERHT